VAWCETCVSNASIALYVAIAVTVAVTVTSAVAVIPSVIIAVAAVRPLHFSMWTCCFVLLEFSFLRIPISIIFPQVQTWDDSISYIWRYVPYALGDLNKC
jgi:hypothetical protein